MWAILGAAKALFSDTKFRQTETLLRQIIEQNPLCVDAYDLLANLQDIQNHFEEAQHILSTAVKTSPGAANRQLKLGRISFASGNHPTAIKAYHCVLKPSKNACQECPEDDLNFSQNLAELAKTQPNRVDLEILNEAADHLKKVDKKYGGNPLVQISSKLVTASLLKIQDQQDKMQAALDSAMDILHKMKMRSLKYISVEPSIDCAKGFMDFGFYNADEKCLQALIQKQPGPEHSLSIDKLLREAVKAFQVVLSQIPNHIGVNLNLIQALVSKHKKEGGISEREHALLKNGFTRLGSIFESSKPAERFEYLEKCYKNSVTNT